MAQGAHRRRAASTSSTTRSAATSARSALRGTAWKGRFLVIGFAAGDIPRIPLNLPLLKGCSIVGVFYGEHGTRSPGEQRALVAELIDMLAAGRIKPAVSAQFSLDDAALALRELMDRHVIGKAVVIP